MDMIAKEYLMRYQAAKKQVFYIQERIENLRAELLPGGINYDGMPKGGDPKTAADIIAQIDEYERRLNAQCLQALKLMVEITGVIARVSSLNCRDVLLERYISGKSWNRIADDEGYSWRHIMRLHEQGLAEVSSILTKMT